MTTPAAAPCPTCGDAAVSVITDLRLDASGEHEKQSMTCSAGHSWAVTEDLAPGPVRRAWTHLRA